MEYHFGISTSTLVASLLGNLLIGKGAIATSQGREANMPGQGKIRTGEGEGTTGASQNFQCCLIV